MTGKRPFIESNFLILLAHFGQKTRCITFLGDPSFESNCVALETKFFNFLKGLDISLERALVPQPTPPSCFIPIVLN